MELIEGESGVFEVEVEGRLVFSKRSEGRFPRYQEVPTAIKAAGSA